MEPMTLPIPAAITSDNARADAYSAADRAHAAFIQALADPFAARHRVDITNALNYIETIVRQENRT